MVWIHGGGFASGSGNSKKYGPEFLVAEGIILVSINYRLGVFGKKKIISKILFRYLYQQKLFYEVSLVLHRTDHIRLDQVLIIIPYMYVTNYKDHLLVNELR